MAYADYDFYVNVYFGNAIAEEDFPRLSERASDYIRAYTQGLSDKVEERWQQEAVQKCTCAISEIELDSEIMTASVYSGESAPVSSETVGSWSRSYKSPSLSMSEVDYLINRKREALMLYLGNLPFFASLFKVRSFRCVH